MKSSIFAIATISILVAVLKPKIAEFGVFRTVPNLNNDRCQAIKGLESCEDIFVDHPTGLAYLACSRLKQRAIWVPALGILNVEKLQDTTSVDYIAILDLETFEYRKLSLSNLPSSLIKNGLYLHGLDLFIPPSSSNSHRKATLFLINHRPPTQGSNHPDVADSVVEVFDTLIGSNEATYRTTIKHDLILTPNNLVAMSENSFYVSNDHAKKKHWTRNLDPFYSAKRDGVVYCTTSEETVGCISALHASYPFSNGIAKGPDNLLYLANSMNSHLRFLEIQSDSTLKVKKEIKVPRNLDNIYVSQSGSIFLACIPRMFQFLNLFEEFNMDKSSLISPSEVWKISNDTSIQSGKTKSFKLEHIFGDDGNLVSGMTGVAVWNSKLFLTGIATTHVSVCEVEKQLTT